MGGGLDFEAPISKVVRYLRSLQHGPISSHLSRADRDHLDYSVEVLTSASANSMFVPDLSNQIRSLTADFHANKQRNAAAAAAAAAGTGGFSVSNDGNLTPSSVAASVSGTGGGSLDSSMLDHQSHQPGSSSSAALSDSPQGGPSASSAVPSSIPEAAVVMHIRNSSDGNGTATTVGVDTQLPERRDLSVVVPTTPEVRMRSVTTAPAAVTAGNVRAAGRGRTPVAGIMSPPGISLPSLSSVPNGAPITSPVPVGHFNFRRADSARALLGGGNKETKGGTTPIGGWRSLPGALSSGNIPSSHHEGKDSRVSEKSRRGRAGHSSRDMTNNHPNATKAAGVGTVLDEETVKWVEQELASTSPAVESPVYSRTKAGSPESRVRSEVESTAKQALGPGERRRSMSFMSRLNSMVMTLLGILGMPYSVNDGIV
jgi:hypothetical protein